MKSITAQFFEVKIRYEKIDENGKNKKVSELYTIDAMSFSEAESRMIEEACSFIAGEFIVDAIKKAPYGEVFVSDYDEDDRWYVAKLAFITMDEKTEKEKRTFIKFLIQASDFDTAKTYIQRVLSKTAIDYVIDTLTETKIIDVYLHESK